MTCEYDIFRIMVKAMLCRVKTTRRAFGHIKRVGGKNRNAIERRS